MEEVDLRLSFGAMFLGCVISVYLSGIGATQTYQYFRHYGRKDTRFISSTVLAVWIMDFVHTIFVCQAMWYYLILKWGDSEELDILYWPVAASIAVTGVVTLIVQLFFTFRVWRFSKCNIFLSFTITCMAFVRFGSAIATTVKMIQSGHFSTFIDEFRWIFTFGLAVSCAIELLLTSSLCYYLQVNRSGYSTMDEIIHRLLMYTISNGVLTTLGTLLAMIFVVALPNSFLFISLHFIIAKTYLNSLLATLNSRDALKKRDSSEPVAYQISVEGHSQPRFRRYTPNHRSQLSNERPIPLTHANNFDVARRPSTGDVKVHIRVEEEVHRSDADADGAVEYSPERSFKSPGLSP